MNILKFEMKKLFKQKKLYILLVIILLVSCGLFIQNNQEYEEMQERAREEIRAIKDETDAMGSEMRVRHQNGELTELEGEQYEHLKDMSTAFYDWNNAISKEEWHEIPVAEQDFLVNLQLYEKKGGEYTALQGIEREKAIAKNNWMIGNNIAYEDEVFPTSPHLLLKENVTILLGIFGVILLFLLFGNIMTTEKEQNTWLTLSTEPVAKWKWNLWKYAAMLLSALIYLLLAIGMAIIIPLIFGEYSLNLSYPQVVTSGDTVAVLSTFEFVSRVVVIFMSASAVVFSLVLFISKWVRYSFTALVFTGFLLIIGFVLTNTIEALQTVWNPLDTLRIGSLIETAPQSTDWLYPVIALIWSAILLSLVYLLPDKEFNIFGSSHGRKPFKSGKTSGKKSPFWNSIIFESRKIRRRGLLVQTGIVLILLMIFGTAIFSHHANKNEQYYVDIMYLGIEGKEEHLSYLYDSYDDYDEFDIDEDNRKELIEQNRETISYYEEDILLLKEAISAIERNEWKPLHEYQLRSRTLTAGEGLENHLGAADVSQLTLEAGITENEWLLEYDIQPVYYVGNLETMYDPVKRIDDGEVLYKVDASGLYSLYYYFKKYIFLLPIVLLLFLIGGGFADERGKKNTLQFLKTEPIRMKSLYNGKIAHSIIISLLSSVGFLLFVIFIGLVFDRLGDWYYPILHYDSKSVVEAANYSGDRPFSMDVGYHFVPLGEMLIRNGLLFISTIIFLVTLSQTLSVWLKGKLAVMAATAIVVTGGYVFSTKKLVDQAHLIPFTYFDVTRITNGQLATMFNNPELHTLMGVVVLLVATVVLVVVGNLSLRKR